MVIVNSLAKLCNVTMQKPSVEINFGIIYGSL